eukprot:scaffold138709_cov20-Tisochrysis_lutea.AAC.1
MRSKFLEGRVGGFATADACHALQLGCCRAVILCYFCTAIASGDTQGSAAWLSQAAKSAPRGAGRRRSTVRYSQKQGKKKDRLKNRFP